MEWNLNRFVKRLNSLRIQRGRRKVELGEAIGGTKSTYSAFARKENPSNPTLKQLCALAEILDVSPGWLAFGAETETMNQREVELIRTFRKLPEKEQVAWLKLLRIRAITVLPQPATPAGASKSAPSPDLAKVAYDRWLVLQKRMALLQAESQDYDDLLDEATQLYHQFFSRWSAAGLLSHSQPLVSVDAPVSATDAAPASKAHDQKSP